MTNPVTLSTLLLFLAALPGFLQFGGGRKGTDRVPTAADSLPPPWKPASRLALESRFVFGTVPPLYTGFVGFRVDGTADRRQLSIDVEPDSGTHRSSVDFAAGTGVGDVSLGLAARQPLGDWAQESMRQTFRRQWREKTRQSINSLGVNTPAARTQGLQIKLPEVLPQKVQSWLGPGGPALNVSGTENIRLSGQSNWSNQSTGLLGQRRSLFPTLDMQQDLDIRLEGQLSDRIKVNLLQNSANQIPLANRIAINYKGDEDDFVQALDLGNTSLSLPGTQYVSYSGRNEGLFGAKLATRIGPLDFTALASRQEGRSERAVYQGSSSRTSQSIADRDYIKGRYFFLFDPNRMAEEGFNADIEDSSIRVYLDDADYNNDSDARRGSAVVDPNGLGFVAGGLPGAADSAFRGNFNLLVQGTEDGYDILSDLYFLNGRPVKVLRLRRALDPTKDACLAVSYVQRRVDGNGTVSAPEAVGGTLLPGDPGSPDSARVLLKMIRAPRTLQTPKTVNNVQVFDPDAIFNAPRELELRNFYQLPGFGIDLATFKMSIRRGQDDPPRTSVPAEQPIPYIEVLGLDNYDETSSPPVRGQHDGRVDGTAAASGARLFLDPENGVLFFYEPRPFAPRFAPSAGQPFEALLSGALSRRESLDGALPATTPNDAIYDKYTVLPADALFYLDVEFTAGRGGGGSDIALGRTNITEGSEAVTVNGERWTRDRDYTIDYDLGRITLKRGLGATDQLNIDYAYAPLFAQAGKTLLGSAFTLQGRDRSLGGAFLYESKGAQDLRPRLGEEPSRTLITDLNGELRFRPSFLTRMVDRLPGVRTTAPSEFNVQAEVGASFPNPNTRNEVFIDDMEGVRDAVSLPMSPERWRWSSVPSRPTLVQAGRAIGVTPFTSLPGQTSAELHWYTPPSVVKEYMLRPNLSEAQGAKNARQTLALSVPRRPISAPASDTMWVGLTYPLDPVGLDLSRAQFIELWVNDFRDVHGTTREDRIRGLGVKLHVDLGVVSEDMMRAPNRPPNRSLDTEDRNKDNQLTVAGSNNEDTGFDGQLDAGETAPDIADLVTANANDREGDNWASPNSDFPDELDPKRWVTTNGSDGNKSLILTPDTEDLNLNGNLDQNENYFEYTIDLGDTAHRYLNTDVYRDFRDDPNVLPEYRPGEGNGWRRFRIPINDSLRVQFGNPDLTIARHVRIWLEGLQQPDWDNGLDRREHRGTPLVMLGGFEVVGSRWLLTDLTPAQRDTARTTVTLNSVNTVDNADRYVAPFDPGRTRSGSLELVRREQSIALEFTDLDAADTLEAYKTFSLEENYSRYGKLRWYAAGFQIPGYDPLADDLSYFVRFASDERGQNYYEIKRRVPRSSTPRSIGWEEVQAEIEKISRFKLAEDFPRTDPILYRAADPATGDSIVIKGRPSFTRIRRISFGLINGGSSRPFPSGQLWFNELRATDVAKDVGIANRFNVGGAFANLMRYNVSWNGRDADFLSVGESRGSGSRTGALTMTGSFDVHRFFEGTAIQVPVNYTFSRNVSSPRFNAGDDVVRDAAAAKASETRSTNQTISTAYSRTWSERSNPLLRYTLGGITAGFSRTQSKSVTPSGLDSSVATNGNVNYGIQPRRLLPLGMPGTKLKLYPLPERLYWNYSVNSRSGRSFERPVDNRDTLVLRNVTTGRTAFVDFGADTRPIDLISHHIEGRRNLALENFANPAFVNFGKLVSWRQSLTSRVSGPPQLWFRPTASWSSAYSQNNGPELSPDLKVLAIGNNQNASVQFELPFDRLAGNKVSTPPPVVPARAPDSTYGPPVRPPRPPRPPLTWRSVVRRLGNLSTESSLSKSSSYGRMRGTVSPLYLFGLTENPGQKPDSSGRIVSLLGNQENVATEFRTRGQTRIEIVQGSFLATTATYNDRTDRTNGVTNRRLDWQFPNVQVEYGNIAQAVGLTRWLQSPQIRTSYSHGVERTFTNTRENETGRSSSNQWQPLIALSGNLKNGTRAEFNINLRSSERLSFLTGRQRTTDNNADVNLSLNRNYSKGQKVTFLGKTSTVSSNVSLGLTANYNRRSGETRNLLTPNAQPQNPIQEDRLNVNGTGSYDFSQNVRGTGSIGFSQTRDLDKEIVRRSLRLEARAQFTF